MSTERDGDGWITKSRLVTMPQHSLMRELSAEEAATAKERGEITNAEVRRVSRM